MEKYTDIGEDLPEESTMDTGSEPTRTEKMFTAKDIPEIVRLFREADADGGGGLDMDEFCVAMEQLYGTVNKEDLIVLHMQIDTNCDKTVDIGELMDFLLDKHKASEMMDYKNQPFPKPIKIIPVNHHRAIVGLLFRPYEDGGTLDSGCDLPTEQTRTYRKGQYISITSNGILNFWTDSFDKTCPIALFEAKKTLPHSHSKKMCVKDMVYLRELGQLAISTSERQLLFHDVNMFPELFKIRHSLIVEDNIVNTMHYWSNGTKAVFSFGDVKGFLSVFISYNVQKNGLFCKQAYETISLQDYPTVYVSALLKNPSKDFLCVKVPIFNDVCSQIRYFPSLDSFAICGSSSKTMVLTALPESPGTKVSKTVFESSRDKEFFTCVEHSPSAGRLVTGGTDGLLRVWFPHQTMSCELTLTGHVKPITHVMYNHKDKIFISLSEDKNIRVWSEDGWLCKQSFQVAGMGPTSISSTCYSVHNNELILANTNIGKYLGRGTDVFKNTLTSHNKPLCSALYHSIFKQVVSVCQNGVVTVWNILTGKTVMEFKVTPDQHVGLTAMAFDGPQRRLITISQDGKVRLWNFNNGTELAVLPVTVPKEVTAIVCINNRVFVSGRNCKKIFDLDIEKHDNRFLEHDYLNDISSMGVHRATLVTASSNGNIVSWDADTGEALYWLNASKSPKTQMVSKRAQGRTGSLPFEKSRKNVRGAEITLPKKHKALAGTKTMNNSHLILCLETREVNVDTATLLTSAHGYIYAWSVKSKGGLLGKFSAVKDEGAIITTMWTDVNEILLLTGDSSGRIYIWDIQNFGYKKHADKDINGWRLSLSPPPLLGSWRAHSTGVVSVQCDPACNNIITAGLDCNVRLWTNTGCCIGLFGKDEWGGPQVSCERNADQELEEERRPGTVETRCSSIPFPDSPRSTSPMTKLPDLRAMSKLIRDSVECVDDMIDRCNPKPIPPDKELFAECRKLLKLKPELDKMKNFDLPPLVSKKNKKSERQPENTTTPSPPEASATTGCAQATNSSAHMQKCNGAVEQGCGHTAKHVHFPPILDTVKLTNTLTHTPCPPEILPGEHLRLPPISDKIQLIHHQTQFKPHPPQTPLIRGGTDLKQSSPLPESLNQNRSKHGSLLKIRQRDTLKGSKGVLTPCPPDILPSQHLRLPPISDKIQLTHHQTQFKPHPPQTPLIRDGTDPKQSAPLPESLNQTRSKHGRLLKIRQRDTLKGSKGVLTPCPPDILPSQHLRLPPISDKVQLTHHQTQFKPHPPQTPLIRDGTGLKQSSPLPESLNQTRSKHGSLLKIQQRHTLKGSKGVLTPCPPVILPSQPLRLPPISDKIQLTHHQTQFKPHPPQTPLIRGGTDLKQSAPLPESLNQTWSKHGRLLKIRQRDTLKVSKGVLTPCPPDILPGQHLRLPPISDKVQLTHHQAQLKPHPPQTLLTAGCTKAMNKLPRFSGERQ